MDAQQYFQAMDLFTQTVSAQYGNRQENINERLADLRTLADWKREISRLRADQVTITYFVEEDGADDQVKAALEFFAEKMEFKGDVIASRTPSSNNKNYFFVQAKPRRPLIGEGFFDEDLSEE